MTALWWYCWLAARPIARAARHVAHVTRPIRRHRRAKRAAKVAAWKWVCVAVPATVGPGVWLGWPAAPPAAMPPVPFATDLSPDFFELPPGLPYALLTQPPVLQIAGPPVLLPDVPIETPLPVPEPASLALLIPMLAALAAWRNL